MIGAILLIWFTVYVIRRVLREEAATIDKVKQYFGLRSKCCNAKIVTNYLAPDKTIQRVSYCTACKERA